MPVSMSDVELLLSACDGNRERQVIQTARIRFGTALRDRVTRPDPIQLMNGDLFVFEI
jgi:hypothetical protein